MEDTTIYSRWLNNELSEKEKETLRASGDLEILERIVAETDSWGLPERSESSLHDLQQKIKRIRETGPKTFPVNRSRTMFYGIAASVSLLLAVSCFLVFSDNTVSYHSEAGQTMEVTLPDNTLVRLYGKSHISINESDFTEDRQVELKGQAYFEVNKKGSFTVHFEQGNVRSLGTRFDILSRERVATVKCYEGRVRVAGFRDVEDTLSAGQGLRIIENKTVPFPVEEDMPEISKAASVFKDAPLLEVMAALSVYYNVEFSYRNIGTGRKYSGKFSHSDLNKALDMVFGPMGIDYTLERSGEGPVQVVLH